MFDRDVSMEVIRWALDNGQDINQCPDAIKEKLQGAPAKDADFDWDMFFELTKEAKGKFNMRTW